MQFTFLGTGCPVVSLERYGPAHLVQHQGVSVLVDCGSGVTQRLLAASGAICAVSAGWSRLWQALRPISSRPEIDAMRRLSMGIHLGQRRLFDRLQSVLTPMVAVAEACGSFSTRAGP